MVYPEQSVFICSAISLLLWNQSVHPYCHKSHHYALPWANLSISNFAISFVQIIFNNTFQYMAQYSKWCFLLGFPVFSCFSCACYFLCPFQSFLNVNKSEFSENIRNYDTSLYNILYSHSLLFFTRFGLLFSVLS